MILEALATRKAPPMRGLVDLVWSGELSGEEAASGHIFDLHHVDNGVDHNGLKSVVGKNTNADCVGSTWVQNARLK